MLKNIVIFIKNNYIQVKLGGWGVFQRKFFHFLYEVFPKYVNLVIMFVPAIICVVFIRVLSPKILIRIDKIIGQRIGHFAANTELYLCERKMGINTPKFTDRYYDIFWIDGPISNIALLEKWKDKLLIFPKWILYPIYFFNSFFRGFDRYQIGQNTSWDRDVLGLYEKLPPNIEFDNNEILAGEEMLEEIGVRNHSKIVCLTVRDSEYLSNHLPYTDWSYHNYRDSDIEKYELAVKALVNLGYIVIRMGVCSKHPITIDHKNVIDYAFKDMHDPFLDLYIAYKCEFCISVGTGFDALPIIFRKPILYVNTLPLGYINSMGSNVLIIYKHHIDSLSKIELSPHEVFDRGVGYCMETKCYPDKMVSLLDNSDIEILDATIEMVERLEGAWIETPEEIEIQKIFWSDFPINSTNKKGMPLHGRIRAKIGSKFLKSQYRL